MSYAQSLYRLKNKGGDIVQETIGNLSDFNFYLIKY